MTHPRGPFVTLLVLLFAFLSSTTFRAQSSAPPAYSLLLSGRTFGAIFNGFAADGNGGVWAVGWTDGRVPLPTTPNAIKPQTSQFDTDGFIAHLGSDGSILYLSYVGGNRGDQANAVAVDAHGYVYVTGDTTSLDFPVTQGSFQTTCAPEGTCRQDTEIHADAFVMKLTPDGSSIVYSTYFGGNSDDEGYGIAVDSQGRAHVIGDTFSTDLPHTVSVGGSTSGSRGDAFYARLSADGSTLEYGTYLGGGDVDLARAIAIDGVDNVYVTGETGSRDFPVLRALKSTFPASANTQAWLAKFNQGGLEFSTFIGGSGLSDYGKGVAVSPTAIYVSGATCDPDFPGAPPRSTGNCGNFAAFVTKIALDGSAILRSVLLDGSGNDQGGPIAVDARDVVYVGGRTGSTDFPVTPDAAQPAAAPNAAATSDVFAAVVPMGDGDSGAPSYASYLGGSDFDQAAAIARDGAGGMFVGGWSSSADFPTINESQNSATTSHAFIARFAAAASTRHDVNGEVVLYARDAASIQGNWQLVRDVTAAAGDRMWNPDSGMAKITTPAASPSTYFDVTFQAQAGKGYHLWLRMRADGDSFSNDSVWVQFSDSVDASGTPIWRTGTTNGTFVSLEDCSGCGEQGWGWNDNGYGVPGTLVYFPTTGPHTIRVQQREDGVSIDQIVLSSAKYLNAAPGANKNDSTVIVQSSGAAGTTGTNAPPAVSITSPPDDATFAEGANIDLTASASDSDGSVSQVQFYSNNSPVGPAVTSPPYKVTMTNAAAGMYALTAVATDNQGASTTSAAVTIRVTGGTHLPAGWTDADVGATGAAGSATYSNDSTGVFTVKGAGADVWGTADAFHYAWTTVLTGDGSVEARVLSVSDEANWVKAGVMIRTSLDPSSAQAFMFVSHAKGVCFQRRVSDGGATVSTCGSSSTAPRWVQLTRTGNVITGYESADGQNWTMVGSDTFTIPNNPDAGLAVSSHIAGTLATATFDRVLVYQTNSGGGQCGSLTLSQTSFYSGGPASSWQITVTAPNETCTWTATIDQSWLALNGVTGPTTIAGTGSGTLTLQTLDNHTGANRVGTFTIGGTAYTVTQEPF